MLEAPWALLALLSLPILIWIHRRRRQGVPVDVPSLLFLEPEDVEAIAPDRRRFDVELALTLLAATCLALAAAGPTVAIAAPKPRVRVVLDASPAMEAKATPTSKSPREQAEAALAALGLSDSIVRARGKPTDLIAAARREPADVRIIVSDRAITPAPPDVHVAAYGDPSAENAGIVAMHLERGGRGWKVLVTIWNHSLRARDLQVEAERSGGLGGLILSPKQVFRVAPDSAASLVFEVAEAEIGHGFMGLRASLKDGGALGADDSANVRERRLVVSLEESELPPAHRRAVRDALDLLADVMDSPKPWPMGLHVGSTPKEASVVVLLHPLKEGAHRVATSGTAERDLDPVLDAVDAGGAECLAQPGLWKGPGLPPLVHVALRTETQTVYEWIADPLAGSPAPVDTPAWPVFWANVVERMVGRDVGAGWSTEGILDPDVTRLGRDRIPIDPAWITEANPAAPEPRDLRLPLIAGGVLCLLLLWFAPRGRRVATVG